jgi:hypothetical protein
VNIRSTEDVIETFGDSEVNAEELTGIDFIAGNYEASDYEGSAYVVFRRDGKWYEVSDGHCSCNSLSWSPSETNPVSIAKDLAGQYALDDESKQAIAAAIA